MKKIILLTLFHLLTSAVGAQVIVEDSKESYPLRGLCRYFLDHENLTVEQVFEKPFASGYKGEWYAHDGYFWIAFDVDNQSANADFILTIDQWQEAELYRQINGKWTMALSGTQVNPWDRPESLHRLLTFPIHQEPNTKVTYFLKAKVENTFIRYYAGVYDFLSKLEWEVASTARSKYIMNQVVIFFVLGLCFALMIFNGVRLFFNLKPELLFLFLYIIVTALFIANIHGVATIYMFPFVQSFELLMGFILVHLSSVLIALYVRSFLKTKGWELENVLLLTMAAIMGVSLIYAWIDQQPHWYYWRRYAEAGILSLTLAIAIYKKRRDVYYLIAAFFFALSGRYISEYLSVFDLFVWSDVPYLIGFLIQLTLFTVGSSVRMNKLEKEYNITLLEKQEMLEGQNRRLNDLVEQRTAEIQMANQEISIRNEELRDTIRMLKGTQQRLIETENMAVIGRLTGGLAHELNNPLNVIGGMIRPIRNNVEEIKSTMASDPEGTSELLEEISLLLADIEIAAKKATGVVKNLGSITPGRMFQKKTEIDLAELIHDLLGPIREKSPGVTFYVQASQQVILICWPEELAKMIENIVHNAVDAIRNASEGIISIDIEKEENEVAIFIRDNGTGMEPEILRHIFEPFFTTKTLGQGTGLGLFISRTIAHKHGGTITATSTPGEGSSFKILLPLPDQK